MIPTCSKKAKYLCEVAADTVHRDMAHSMQSMPLSSMLPRLGDGAMVWTCWSSTATSSQSAMLQT
jgi:hypothetical protein